MVGIDCTTKKCIFLEDFWFFIKNQIYDISSSFIDTYTTYGAKIITLEEWRDIQLNKILENV